MSDAYVCAALAIDALDARSTSIHAACAGVLATHQRQQQQQQASTSQQQHHATPRRAVDARRLTALVANTLAFRKPLTLIMESAKLLTLEPHAFKLGGREAKGKGKGSGSAKGKGKGKADTAGWETSDADPSTTATSEKQPAIPTPTSLALVLLHDILLSTTRVSASAQWPPRAGIERHLVRLRAELARLRAKEGAASIEQLRDPEEREQRKRATRCPRWVRVNSRRASRDKVVKVFEEQGWSVVEEELLGKSKHMHLSKHLPDVIAFPNSATSTLLTHPLYLDGTLILQDLASCFPAAVLLAQPTAASSSSKFLLPADGKEASAKAAALHVIDATAAPGNKTSHLSALLAKSGVASQVTAFEHSPARFQTLVTQLLRAGALSPTSTHLVAQVTKGRKPAPTSSGNGNKKHIDAAASLPGAVTPHLGDFLATDPAEAKWADVKGMLLDPSCSGSGIVGRMEYDQQVEEENEEAGTGADGEKKETSQAARLASLAAFQLSMIEHALKFPTLERLVYSTCSIHAEENEQVVRAALKLPAAQAGGWRVASRAEVIPTWPVRGLPEECGGDEDMAQGMIRAYPGGKNEVEEGKASVEATNGFFVACFVRTGSAAASKPVVEAEARTEGKEDAAEKKRRKKKEQKKRKREAVAAGNQEKDDVVGESSAGPKRAKQA